MDDRRFFVNGWKESRSYFMSLVNGNITSDQQRRLLNGEEITIGDNTFRIEHEK